MSYSPRRFSTGALLGLLLFVALTALATHLRSDFGLRAAINPLRCFDCIRRIGFPLTFYEEGGYAYRKIFDGPAFAVDSAAALTIGVMGGLVAERFRKPRR
ncbi:MAG TPA: hypothetical protein VHG32_22105 [Thermoanaerobaculia bacterium]|jgi:hypothetical protein|nr:hypothetical protein [Thermoanaerobaculia bacterium]